jgi:hypothetical protein
MVGYPTRFIGQEPGPVSPNIERQVHVVTCDVTSEHHRAHFSFRIFVFGVSCAYKSVWSAVFARNCVCHGSIDVDGRLLSSL